jgi:hypothetical protein
VPLRGLAKRSPKCHGRPTEGIIGAAIHAAFWLFSRPFFGIPLQTILIFRLLLRSWILARSSMNRVVPASVALVFTGFRGSFFSHEQEEGFRLLLPQLLAG